MNRLAILPEQRERVISAAADGVSRRDLARRFGCGKSTIDNIITDAAALVLGAWESDVVRMVRAL